MLNANRRDVPYAQFPPHLDVFVWIVRPGIASSYVNESNYSYVRSLFENL